MAGDKARSGASRNGAADSGENSGEAGARYCPVCEQASASFLAHGVVGRDDALCPVCRSHERHRLVLLFMRRHTDLFDGRPMLLADGRPANPMRMLHVAPEPELVPLFSAAVGTGYLTADIANPAAMEQMDIMDIRHAEASFDVVYCSHVLEHIADDRKAMREFHRVLKPGGWAILLVPVIAANTWEDPAITDPDERIRHFGRPDHVRAYGPDFADRLAEAGFAVEVTRPGDMLAPADIVRLGLANGRSGDIYFCRK